MTQALGAVMVIVSGVLLALDMIQTLRPSRKPFSFAINTWASFLMGVGWLLLGEYAWALIGLLYTAGCGAFWIRQAANDRAP
jgi:hypothetical protein